MANTSKPSLAETHPEIAETADGWDPSTVSAKSGMRRNWKCKFGHQWNSIVANRTGWSGCPICSGRKVLAGVNDLGSLDPEVAEEAFGWDPSTVTLHSNKKREWKCKDGHKWVAKVEDRTGKDRNGCPYCSGLRPIVGINDLATTHPELAKTADGWDPKTVKATSGRKMAWVCKKGHKWRAAVTDLMSTTDGKGCPYCSNKKVLAGFNDIATTNPDVLRFISNWDPTKITWGHNKKVLWQCELGHTWKTTPRSKIGCPYCSNKKVLAGFNDLKTVRPDIAAEADGWDPTTVVAGTYQRRKWVCDLGHHWTTPVKERSVGRGCPSCANSGFDPNKPGFLYFIDHFDLDMFQIGITNSPDNRLNNHGRHGWEVIELRGPMDGQLTRQLETNCLHALEKRGAILGHKAGIEKFDGYSEAWTKASLNVTSIKQILDWVYEDETK